MTGLFKRLVLKFGTRNLFSEVEFRQARHDQIMRMPQATRRYAMFFTPRSGSSRLTDLAELSGVLGRPDECFNPQFVPTMAQALSARDLPDFVILLTHRRNGQGTFGCQLTYMHLVRTFGSEGRFLSLVNPDSFIWLIRKDIVSQAVSISRMVQTSVSHAPQHSDDDIDRADRMFRYAPRQIRAYIGRVRWMERETEAMFARHGISPLRLSYEQLSKTEPEDFLPLISEHVSSAPLPKAPLVSAHTKIAGPKNAEFAARFRKEHREMIARLDHERDRMIAALNPDCAPTTT